MDSFHSELFNRRSSASTFFGQTKESSHFGPTRIPKPLFSDHQHFAYVADCEICADLCARGHELHHHEHRLKCRGTSSCCCHRCCHRNSSSEFYSARTEETSTDSQFGAGRVRSRSSTTMVGEPGFGFANAESEMLRFAADNRWRSANNDSFYGPMGSGAPKPAGHLCLSESPARAFESHQNMHASTQAYMRDEAMRAQRMNRESTECTNRESTECDKSLKRTTTTTTVTVKESKDSHCDSEKHESTHHKSTHHMPVHAGPVIVPGTAPPDSAHAEPAKPGSCCTWCKILPCLDCPKPTNANARFNKKNFRLFPEYEFLPDDYAVPPPTDYFPQHVHSATRRQYKITIPQVHSVAQRVYVDFIGDQLVVLGEHGLHASSNRVGGSTRSGGSRDHVNAHYHGMERPHAIRVFAKNFFLPRDTYDRNRAQVFIKPNGKLKIVVPVIGM